jgi:hypothetical protein
MKTYLEEFLNLINQEVKKNEIFFKYKHNILSKYMDLKDSPPFEIYFEKQFLRIINKNINKYSFFKTTRKALDTPIIESIILKIDNSFKFKIEVIDESNNLNTISDNSITNKKNSNNNKSIKKISNNRADNNENSNIIQVDNRNNNDKAHKNENSNKNISDNMNSNNDNNKISNNNNPNNSYSENKN